MQSPVSKTLEIWTDGACKQTTVAALTFSAMTKLFTLENACRSIS